MNQYGTDVCCAGERVGPLPSRTVADAPLDEPSPSSVIRQFHCKAECRSVQVVAQHLGPAGVAQLRHRLGLDLANAFTGHAINLPDLVQGAGLPVSETEAQPYYARLALRQRLEHRLQL